MTKKILFIFLLFLTIIPLNCFAINSAGFNGLDLDLLTLGYDVPGLALAESNIAMPKNPYGGLENPASLKDLESGAINSMHGFLGLGIEIYGVNFAYPITPEIVVNINWLQFQVTEIPLIPSDSFNLNEDIEATEYANYISNGLISALSYTLTPEFSLGASLSLFFNEVQNYGTKGWGYSFSPGFTYQISDNLFIGGYLKNLFSSREWQTGYIEQLGKFIELGTAYKFENLILSLAFSRQLTTVSPIDIKYGAEYIPFPFLALRLGAYTTSFNGGIGLKLGQFTIDYTYLGETKNNLANNSRLAVGLLF